MKNDKSAFQHLKKYLKFLFVRAGFIQKSKLENTESDAQVFFRILPEIINQLRAFACQLIDVAGGLIDVIV